MTWFKVDDTAHTHPKLRRAGTAAIGLWTLGGSYAAQYLTDGIVHAEFVKANGTGPQVAKLVRSGLWHPAGHGCPRCPHPEPGDYFIHDYLVYNFSRARVLADRERAAEKKRKQRAGEQPNGAPPPRKPTRFEAESKTNRDGIEDVSTSKDSLDPDDTAGHRDPSPGDSRGPRARAAARPDPVVPPNGGTTAAAAGDRSGFPDRLQPLRDALASHPELLPVAWDIRRHTDWERIRQCIDRFGVDVLVANALGNARLKGAPASVTAWISGWECLQQATAPAVDETDTEPGGTVVHLRAPRGLQATGTDATVAGHQAITAQLAALEAQQGNR